MVRIIIGSAAAAIVMFVLAWMFHASGLERIAHVHLDDTRAAAVQGSLAVNLPKEGTYHIPSTITPAQTAMYGRGPIATVHYNPQGFPAMDPATFLWILVLNFLVAVVIGSALIGIDRRVPDFESRAKVVALFAVAASAFINLKQPIFQHHDWTHYLYLFVVDAIVVAAGGLVIARWFLPRHRAAVVDAPSEV